jgi:hypothetical protein
MLTAPHDAKPDQNGLGGLAVRLLCEVGRCAECTVHTAVRLKASRMAITGTVPEVRRLSSFGASSNRFTDTHELNSCGLARRIPALAAGFSNLVVIYSDLRVGRKVAYLEQIPFDFTHSLRAVWIPPTTNISSPGWFLGSTGFHGMASLVVKAIEPAGVFVGPGLLVFSMG